MYATQAADEDCRKHGFSCVAGPPPSVLLLLNRAESVSAAALVSTFECSEIVTANRKMFFMYSNKDPPVRDVMNLKFLFGANIASL